MDEDYLEEGQEYALPPNGLISSIIIGCVGGIIALLVPVAIVLFNAPLFSQASRLGDKMSYQVAASITAWQCSGTFVNLIIAFIVGIVAGRIVVKRKLGFLAGAVAGAVVYLGIFLVHYIPGYPDIISSGTTKATGTGFQGVLAFMILLVIYALVAGLMSLWGTLIATRTHPYYHPQIEE